MCLMNIVLIKFLEIFVLVFINDIMIYSKSGEDHEEHLKSVLQVIIKQKIYAKFSKCDLFSKRVNYLGHVCSIPDQPNAGIFHVKYFSNCI
jgi:hypothetical protein